MTTDPSRDVRDLLGMRTRAARILVGLYAGVTAVVAFFGAAEATSVWPIACAVAVCSLAAYALVAAPGDPLPLRVTIPLAFTGVASSALVLSVAPVPAANDIALWWPFGMSTVIFTFMCVRGRTPAAWFGMACMITTAAVWAQWTGRGAGFGLSVSVVNVAPLLMSTFFAYTLRPLAKAIYVLRETTLRTSADRAASDAALEERDVQLDRLDARARPLLERIATGVPLRDDERRAAILLEARLRDGLRAPILQDREIVDAADAARRRGVDVVMLDDRGMDDADVDEQRRIRRAVADELDAVSAGSVTVRVLPPGRRALATILVRGETVRRIELGGRSDG